jgi:hypothetical protein
MSLEGFTGSLGGEAQLWRPKARWASIDLQLHNFPSDTVHVLTLHLTKGFRH